jgi:hypothetical protein
MNEIGMLEKYLQEVSHLTFSLNFTFLTGRNLRSLIALAIFFSSIICSAHSWRLPSQGEFKITLAIFYIFNASIFHGLETYFIIRDYGLFL